MPKVESVCNDSWIRSLRKERYRMDYYKILGISQQADAEQIKRAYRRLAKKYHPDMNPDDPEAEARFIEVTEAYEVLSDETKRKEYDLKGRKTEDRKDRGGKKQGNAAPQDINMGDLMKNMERYFGFAPHKGQGDGQPSGRSGEKRNPLDVTEMFEAFMNIK